MSKFNPTIAEIRFGSGLSPSHRPAQSSDQMLTQLKATDNLAKQYPIYGMTGIERAAAQSIELRKQRDNNLITQEQIKSFNEEYRKFTRQKHVEDFGVTLARSVAAKDGFRERLILFWSDHFAVAGKGLFYRHRTNGFTEQAIRPHVSGRFEELLHAAILNPVMITYLDQNTSVGPNSELAQKKSGRGLNENLAREILELHTLGVRGKYHQKDVRDFAKLLAGLTLNHKQATVFNRRIQEPGELSVMGFKTIGDSNRESDLKRFLSEIAGRKETALHLATKLAQHFLQDDPPHNVIRNMAASYRSNNGSLLAMYEVLINHPAAMSTTLAKIKRPIDYLVSSLRAFDVNPTQLIESARQDTTTFTREILFPMARMGQRWGQPKGPNGWPKVNQHWISPNTLAERMRWALRIQANNFIRSIEPEVILDNGLGALAKTSLLRTVRSAETKKEGIALMLMSPSFQRH